MEESPLNLTELIGVSVPLALALITGFYWLFKTHAKTESNTSDITEIKDDDEKKDKDLKEYKEKLDLKMSSYRESISQQLGEMKSSIQSNGYTVGTIDRALQEYMEDSKKVAVDLTKVKVLLAILLKKNGIDIGDIDGF